MSEMKKLHCVYDLETYPNFFLAVFKDIKTGLFSYFEISDRVNMTNDLRTFLYTEGLKLIGYNNLNFDYPILHNTILSNDKEWNSYEIYNEVTNVIETKYSAIWDNLTKIPQLDLYRIWHYDNKNKATSLKWLEFAMRLENVQDLPYKPGSILDDEEKDEVIKYCNNDINATESFFYKSMKHIEIRQFYGISEGLNLINASEIKMAKEIFSKNLSKPMKMSIRDIKKMRTYRSSIKLKDVIFDYIKFNDPINKQALDIFNRHIWTRYNEGIKFSLPYKNVIREYAEGGLHSFGKPGIYKTDDEYILVDVDFASFYPHISFRNKLHPEHIPEKIFSEIYEGFYKERQNYPKSDPRNYVLKIVLNGSYGLSKDEYAFLYDPKWQLAICINGQLILTLLTEKILEAIPETTIIFENTDGAMYRVKRTCYDALIKACNEVENIVNIPLEHTICDKIIIRDVNNYINVINKDTVKYKGCFEINKDFHKNHSKRIVPLALANYYLNDVPIRDSVILKNLDNIPADLKANINYSEQEKRVGYYEPHGIYDYCIGSKMKGDNKLYRKHTEGVTVTYNPLGKVNRYYISNKGDELIKKLPPLEKNKLTETDKHKLNENANQLDIFGIVDDVKVEASDRETNIEAGWKTTLFNQYVDGPYDINYNYYIEECYKIINILRR